MSAIRHIFALALLPGTVVGIVPVVLAARYGVHLGWWSALGAVLLACALAFFACVPPDHRLRGRVELREGLGSEIVVHVAVRARLAVTEDVRELVEDMGEEPPLAEAREDTATVVARFDPHSRVQEGMTAEAAVDTSALHFFDPDTGLEIYEDQPKGVA